MASITNALRQIDAIIVDSREFGQQAKEEFLFSRWAITTFDKYVLTIAGSIGFFMILQNHLAVLKP